ncbi:hypothetical protein [Streptomyces sp. Ru87]|uniref:hypothetical protein n=1 Tax=Streptomyces sp. Ru87 TaxID=2044307 RepID=UPI00211D1D71|nr:hypothetical protein [Streptomyces sp. Ru87]
MKTRRWLSTAESVQWMGYALVEVDVVPVQPEGFALAHAGADEDFEEVGHLGVV